MATFVKIASVWRLATMYVKKDGVWKIPSPSVKVAGAWRTVTNATVSLSGGSSSVSNPFGATAGVRLGADGLVYARGGTGPETAINTTTDWIKPAEAAGAAYEVRATLPFGGSIDEGTLSTWLPLNVSREWLLYGPVGEAVIVRLRLEIRSGSTVLATADYELSAITA